MRVLILGAAGMLGHKLYQRFADRFDVSATIRGGFESIENVGIFERSRIIENIDVRDIESLRRAIDSTKPECVVNAVGVIKQSPTVEDPLATLAINSVLPRRLLRLSDDNGFRLITLSTDCVFDGSRGNYAESDLPDAVDLYGVSKSLGELSGGNALTIRTSMIGRELKAAGSLVEWFLSHRGGSVKGFSRAVFSGFPTIHLADIIADTIANSPNLTGIYHVSGDPIDKLTLLRLLNQNYKAGIEIIPDDSLEIDRSLNSARFRAATGFKPKPWTEMIEEMVSDGTDYDEIRS